MAFLCLLALETMDASADSRLPSWVGGLPRGEGYEGLAFLSVLDIFTSCPLA